MFDHDICICSVDKFYHETELLVNFINSNQQFRELKIIHLIDDAARLDRSRLVIFCLSECSLESKAHLNLLSYCLESAKPIIFLAVDEVPKFFLNNVYYYYMHKIECINNYKGSAAQSNFLWSSSLVDTLFERIRSEFFDTNR